MRCMRLRALLCVSDGGNGELVAYGFRLGGSG